MSYRDAILLIFLVALPTWGEQQPVNMLHNADFEVVSAGRPEGWTLGKHGNECSLSVVPGPQSRYAGRLSCTKFDRGWVILAQDGVVKVTKGQWYRLTFRCRGEGLRGGTSVALYNRKPWENCGLLESFEVRKDWSNQETYFRAARDATDTRFEFYFSSTGALYLDDVMLVACPPPPLKGTLPRKPSGNLVPNGSFELGGYLWGTEGRDSLAAVPIKGGVVGETCLRIAVDPDKAEEYAVDWFEPRFWKVYGNTVATQKWMGVTPGKPVVLSAYLRSGTEPVKARLSIGEADRSVVEKVFEVDTEWSQFHVSGIPSNTGCFVRVGIELDAEPKPCELYVDGVQLEEGDRPTPFAPRSDVEIGLSTDRYGNIFMVNEKPSAQVAACSVLPVQLKVRLEVTDCWDEVVATQDIDLDCPAGRVVRNPIQLTSLQKGFFRLKATIPGRADVLASTLRMARVERVHEMPAGKDGPFGINHASPPDSRLELMRVAGITWVRDWTLKWHQVQPTDGGPFDFSMGDRQIERVLNQGMKVMCVLPHPATPWCTTAPGEVTRDFKRSRQVLSCMPADLDKFAGYVNACVKHFKDRVKVWEILNEPGYMDPVDYAKLLGAAYKAAKAADPECLVMGGCGAGPAGTLGWYRTLFEHGGLKHMDIVNLHPYPGSTAGRAYEQKLITFNECMDEEHRRLPIWVTEYLYCSDDDPLPTVPRQKPAGRCASELAAAKAMVQYNIVFTCYGTQKLFQHTNHWPLRLTRDTLLFSMFFKYGAVPKKPFAAHNVMAWLLGPKPEFVRTLDVGAERFCAVFSTDGKTLAVAWRDRYADDFTLTRPAAMLAYDMMGNAIQEHRITVTDSPIYLVSGEPADRVCPQLRSALGEATE